MATQAPAPAGYSYTMGAISDLPENLLREVFSRVGSVRSLFMLAVTCRGWLRRFTDRAFLREMLCPGRRMFQEGDHRARLLGIFLQHSGFDPADTEMVQVRRGRSESAFAPFFLPRTGSPLGLAGPLAEGNGTFNYAKPLAARHGIVLMRLAPRSTDTDVEWHLFGICNPVTGGGIHVLPPLKDYGCVRGYAIVTAADGDLDNGTTGRFTFTFSQLLVITDSDSHRHSAHSYSAATRSWSTRACRCLDADRFSLVGERSAVVHQGAAHWLCIIHDHGHVQRGVNAATCDNRLYKLSVEVATGGISLTKLPVHGGGKPLLCVTRDGKLAVASVYHEHMTLWTQPAGADQDGSAAVVARSRRKRSAAWPGTSFRIPPAVPDPDGAPKWQSKEEWSNFGQGSILVLYRSGRVFILDLHKKVMKKVGKIKCSPSPWGDRRRVACIAYEMDLVEFFTRQLSGLVRDGLGPE